MKNIYKILAMLLVIAAVVCVAGCANKAPATENNTTPVAPAETNASAVTPAETSAANVTETSVENVTAGNATSENLTANTSVPTVAANVTHLSTVQRHQQIAQQQAQQQQSNSTSAVTPQ